MRTHRSIARRRAVPLAFSALLTLAAAAPVACQAPRPDAIAAGTFAYDRAAPLEWRDSVEKVENGVETRAFSFASPRGGRATGLLFVPQRAGRMAGIVNMHGAPGSARQTAPTSAALASRGAVVIALDAPFARRPEGQPLDFSPADSVDQVQLVVDLQRAVDVLLTRDDVDPARIAYVGGSYGAAAGVMYAAVDPRPAAYVLFVPDGGMVSHFSERDGSRSPRLEGMTDEVWNQWKAAVWPVEGINYVDRIRPGTVYFQNGRQDQFIPVWKAEALHQAAGSSHRVSWYESGHRLPREAVLDRYQWLHERIGTDAVTDEERSAPPPAPARS